MNTAGRPQWTRIEDVLAIYGEPHIRTTSLMHYEHNDTLPFGLVHVIDVEGATVGVDLV